MLLQEETSVHDPIGWNMFVNDHIWECSFSKHREGQTPASDPPFHLWKKGQVTSEEYKDVARTCREKIRKVKAQLKDI